jgi:general stress protein CsbA
MNQPDNHFQTLTEIRSLMERSTKFISLSGLSGVFAGIFALLGAGVAYWYLDIAWGEPYYKGVVNSQGNLNGNFISFFLADALSVLILSLTFGAYFTFRKAKRLGLKVGNQTGVRLLQNLAIPLFAGGVFCLSLLYHQHFGLIAPCTLVFYGLALLNASKYTLHDIRYLGLCEIALGLMASFLLEYALLFWAIGFGVLHIVYGFVMYHKYDTRR